MDVSRSESKGPSPFPNPLAEKDQSFGDAAVEGAAGKIAKRIGRDRRLLATRAAWRPFIVEAIHALNNSFLHRRAIFMPFVWQSRLRIEPTFERKASLPRRNRMLISLEVKINSDRTIKRQIWRERNSLCQPCLKEVNV